MADLQQIAQDIVDTLPAGKDFVEFYGKNMRGSIFSGFLTLSGFLFSVNTFIIVNMKKELYDQAGYLSRFEQQMAFNPKRTLYGPLHRLSNMLILSVASTLATSVCQFTIGLIPKWYASLACLFVAAASIAILVYVLKVIWDNLKDLFEFLDKEAEKKLRERAQSTNSNSTSATRPIAKSAT